jgi:hypothetical protein
MPPRTRSPVARVLADLGRALARAGIDWYLFGAQAAILRGLRRTTVDVDVTVFTELDGERLSQSLGRGFALRVPDAKGFARVTRVLPLVHAATKTDVDVVLGTVGLETHFLERAELLDVEGFSVRVPGVEDLVLMKLIAGRERDIEDAFELVCFDPTKVDVASVRDILERIEEGVGEAGLVDRLDAVVRRLPTRPSGVPRSRSRRRREPR